MDLYRSATILVLILALLGWPAGARAQSIEPGPAIVPAPPGFEDMPALLAPILLRLPWQCGACASGVAPLEPLPEPQPNWYDLSSMISWLGVQLWNRVAYPIVCWMITIAQAVLTAIAVAINAVFVAGINAAWRMLLLGLISAWYGALSFWAALEWFRSLLWQLWLSGLDLSAGVRTALIFIQQLAALAVLILEQLVALLISASSALSYLLGLFFALIPGLVVVVADPTAPPQVAELSNNWFFLFVVDLLRGYADSNLGWSFYAFIAIMYARFGLWLLEELAHSNS